MKRILTIMLCTFFFLYPLALFAQATGNAEGKEIENLVSSVKAANAGDYILLPSGNKYILSKAEIDIANGNFNFEKFSDLASEKKEDGTEVITVSQAHSVYVYPNGQVNHLFRTVASFTALLEYIESCYHLTYYVDASGDIQEFRNIRSPQFNVFRAGVQFQKISNGAEELDSVIITVYNYKGNSYLTKYCSSPEMVWGNIASEGMFLPVGETHEIIFN
ncbi:MAG: hypothetical protein FWH41_06275 [Treponema sp.]|nr:hypothetical protein [Treponema sp.]